MGMVAVFAHKDALGNAVFTVRMFRFSAKDRVGHRDADGTHMQEHEQRGADQRKAQNQYGSLPELFIFIQFLK